MNGLDSPDLTDYLYLYLYYIFTIKAEFVVGVTLWIYTSR